MLWRHLDTSGRIGRGEFWLAVVKTVLLTMLAMALLGALGWASTGPIFNLYPAVETAGELELGAYDLMPFVIGLLVMNGIWFFCLIPPSIRRRHDRGSSGLDVKLLTAFQILMMICEFGVLPAGLWYIQEFPSALGSLYLFIMLGLLPGERKTNRFGPDPREESNASSAIAIGE